MKAFQAWCAAQGIATPLRLCTSPSNPNYRYLASETNDVPAGSNLVSVPLKCCITADTKQALADKLAFERAQGEKSKFAPYIDILPSLQALQDIPLLWDETRLESVTDGGQLEQRVAAIRTDGVVDPWALACVSSRTNYLDDLTYSLTPVLDMLNHDVSVKTKGQVKDGELTLQAVDQSFSAGQEVKISYGDLTNLETLCDYGFCVANNPCNTEDVEVRIIRRPPFSITVAADGSVHEDLAMLRVNLANSQELQQHGDSTAYLQPISKRNEMEVEALLSVTLEDAALEARLGAQKAARTKDVLVRDYLNERANLLEKAAQKYLLEE